MTRRLRLNWMLFVCLAFFFAHSFLAVFLRLFSSGVTGRFAVKQNPEIVKSHSDVITRKRKRGQRKREERLFVRRTDRQTERMEKTNRRRGGRRRPFSGRIDRERDVFSSKKQSEVSILAQEEASRFLRPQTGKKKKRGGARNQGERARAHAKLDGVRTFCLSSLCLLT